MARQWLLSGWKMSGSKQGQVGYIMHSATHSLWRRLSRKWSALMNAESLEFVLWSVVRGFGIKLWRERVLPCLVFVVG